jgi:hypothetical protein
MTLGWEQVYVEETNGSMQVLHAIEPIRLLTQRWQIELERAS